MNRKEKQSLHQMERELKTILKEYFGKNLVSLFVEGSYSNYDVVSGYSDYDMCALVKDSKNVAEPNLESISMKYGIDIQCVVKSFADFTNRVDNNNNATRFIGNLDLVKYKKQARILLGTNIIKLIPPIAKLIKRDLKSELQNNYKHAVSRLPGRNIFKREPRKWVNYIISMSNALLLSSGVVVKKDKILTNLSKFHPKFKGIGITQKALSFRKTKKVLNLEKTEIMKLERELRLFLVYYREYIFC